MVEKIYQKYADYYDILYQYKDYQKECDFLEKLFKRYLKRRSPSLLDLGCGTGGHALLLAKKGYRVTAVDSSERMLKIARAKAWQEKVSLDFRRGDVRNLRLGKRFDAVLLMFNVIGYQIANRDLAAAFKTAASHLKRRGVLILDCWFGPAVLRQMPGPRRQVIKNGSERLLKTSTSVLDILNQTVDIRYKVRRVSKGETLDEVRETHKIRFLFPQEIKRYLEEAGLVNLGIFPFMKLDKAPTFADWNITVVAKKL